MQSFVMALRSIGANKMRAILTMLGIISAHMPFDGMADTVG